MEKETKLDIFLNKKVTDIMITLKKIRVNKCCSNISRKADCTKTHTKLILQKLENSGLVQIEKMGRINKVTLTNKGNEVADVLIAIRAYEM